MEEHGLKLDLLLKLGVRRHIGGLCGGMGSSRNLSSPVGFGRGYWRREVLKQMWKKERRTHVWIWHAKKLTPRASEAL